MFPEFGNLRKKPLITYRRRPLYKEEPLFLPQEPPQEPQTQQCKSDNNTGRAFITYRRRPLYREEPPFLPQEPPQEPQTQQCQSDNNTGRAFITYRRRPLYKGEPQTQQCQSDNNIGDAIAFPPTSSSSSSATNSSTDKDDDDDEEEEQAKKEEKENDIFAFPSEQSKEVKLMIARVRDNPLATISAPKKRSTSKPKQNKAQKQNKSKPKGKPAQTVNSQQKPKQLQQKQPQKQQQQQQQQQQFQNLQPLQQQQPQFQSLQPLQQQEQQFQNLQPLIPKRPMASYDNFDNSTIYSPHLNAGYSNTYYNNTTSSSYQVFNNRVTISSLLDAPPPTFSQPAPSTTINYHPIPSNTFHSSPQFNAPEKKRKRNLIGQLKAASGETPENTNKPKSYSDDEIDDEYVEEPKPISTANALRSLSPELTYEARMEQQLSDIMKSEFGEGIKQEPQQEIVIERKRYEPQNHRNVRVTFKRSQRQQQQESATVDDIDRVNQLISVIKSSQEK